MKPPPVGARLGRMRSLMPLLVAGLLAGLAASAPSARVAACSCMELTAQQAVDNADVVFIGTALDRSQVGRSNDVMRPVQYAFAVEETQKALIALDRQVTVETAADSAMCGAWFEPGTRYRVHANVVDGRLSSSLCSGNQDLGPGLPLETPREPVDAGGVPLAAILGAVALVGFAGFAGFALARR